MDKLCNSQIKVKHSFIEKSHNLSVAERLGSKLEGFGERSFMNVLTAEDKRPAECEIS